MSETHSYLTTDTGAVAGAARHTAGTAGDWTAWGTSAATGFTDAATAVRNAHLAAAIAEHSERWNPVAQRVAGQVVSLGYHTSEAAVTVDDADVTSAHLLGTQTGTASGYGDSLLRPINV